MSSRKEMLKQTAAVTAGIVINAPGVAYNILRVYIEPSKQPEIVQQPWTEEDQQELLRLSQEAEKYIHISEGIPIDTAAASRAIIGISYARWGMSEANHVMNSLKKWYNLNIRLMTSDEQVNAEHSDGKVEGVTFSKGNDRGNYFYDYVLHPKFVELLKNPSGNQEDQMTLILLSGVLYPAADALEGATFNSAAKTVLIFMASAANGGTGLVLLDKAYEKFKEREEAFRQQLINGTTRGSSRRELFAHVKVAAILGLSASLPAGLVTGTKRALDFGARKDEAVGSRDTTLRANGQLETQPAGGVITKDPRLKAFVGNLIIPTT